MHGCRKHWLRTMRWCAAPSSLAMDFELAWQEGRAMTLEQAIDCARAGHEA